MGFGDPETTYVRLKIHTPDEPNMFNEYNVSMRRADTYMHDTRVLAETNERDIDVIQAQLAQVTYTKNGTTTLVNQIHEQTPTVPDTFPTLRVTDLRTYGMGGRLVEGVFCITNSGASAVTIAAETVFATGLSTRANESYTAFVDFAPSQRHFPGRRCAGVRENARRAFDCAVPLCPGADEPPESGLRGVPWRAGSWGKCL